MIPRETVQACTTIRVPAAEGYRRWSSVYDSRPNPMISLEQRVLHNLLPAIKGRDVVDLGCGTGRWLSMLASKSARSLVGLDCSPGMLAIARRKLSGVATLLAGDCDAPPLESRSADLILCSFVLSYLSSVANFAVHLQRIARPDADVFVTDLHPETELRLGWRRGFRDGHHHVQLETHWRSLESILSDLAGHGIRPVAVCEVPFGTPEFEILERAGKSALIPELREQPAIYILQLKAGHVSARSKRAARSKGSVDLISGGRLALAADESVPGEIRFADGRIASLRSHPSRLPARAADAQAIDLRGFLVLPGLVNAHDHLEFALFPRLGRGGYENFSEWANDIHRPDESPVREHRAVPKSTRLWWGAIRNLLCGVTSACHHNPYAAEVFEAGFPVRVVRDFGWAHSLEIDAHAARKHADTPPEHPFIIHLGEGVDQSSAQQLFELDRTGALTDRTVVVHGLALNEQALSLLTSRGAALVWCPTSNEFLFGRTHEPRRLQDFCKVALGSDSSLTAEGDLLDELRFAHEGIGVPAKELYEQVTRRAADVLRLVSGEGSLRVGGFADLMAIRETTLRPAEALVRSTFRNVELVIVGGRVQLASPAIKARLSSELIDGLEPLKISGVVRWIRAPLAHLFADARGPLGPEIRMNGRLLEHGR